MMGNRRQRHTFAELIAAGMLQIGDGYRAKNEELGGNGPIFLRAGHVTDNYIDFAGVERFHAHLVNKVKGKIAQLGDVVVTTKGNSTGRVTYVTEEMPLFVYSPHLSYWRSLNHNVIHTLFLHYWSRSSEFLIQLEGLKASTDMAPYLSLIDQRRLIITLPPVEEQRAIASILGALDDKIELNRQMNATLEAMARALFKSWFVDFDPVRARMEGRQPDGMDAATAALFPNSFEDSPLGKVPKGWRMSTVAEVGSLSRSSLNPADYPDEIFDHYSIPAYDDRYLPKAEPGNSIQSNKFVVLPDSVLLSKLNPRIPRVWLPSVSTKRRSVCSTEFLVSQAKSGVTREYLYALFSSAHFTDAFATLVTGTSGSHQRVKPEYLLAMNVILPPPAVMSLFTKTAISLFDRGSLNLYESSSLMAARDALLPKLLSGEVSVLSL